MTSSSRFVRPKNSRQQKHFSFCFTVDKESSKFWYSRRRKQQNTNSVPGVEFFFWLTKLISNGRSSGLTASFLRGLVLMSVLIIKVQQIWILYSQVISAAFFSSFKISFVFLLMSKCSLDLKLFFSALTMTSAKQRYTLISILILIMIVAIIYEVI